MKGVSSVRAVGVVLLVVSLFAIVGVLTFAGPCVHDDGSTGMCFDASLAIVAAGAVAALLAAATIAARPGTATVAMDIAAACAGVFMAATPGTVFALCMMQTMRCWTLMRPFALVCGIAIAVVALVRAYRALRLR